LAIAFAESQKKILLIDADLRRPTIHTTFGLSLKPGLTEIMQGKSTFEQCLNQDVTPNLDIITCGSLVRNPGRVLSSKQIGTFLEELKSRYSLILIDAPPILVVNDSAALASMADGTLIAISAGTTRLAALNRSKEFLDGAGGTLIGVGLNKFDPRRAYGGYYGSYRYGHYGPGYTYYTPEGGSKKNGEKGQVAKQSDAKKEV
jgi:capsular exopolysaccharide synthesis family protein